MCAGVSSGGKFRKVAGSGEFRCVAGVGSGGRFRKVPESSGVCWCKFRRQVPEGCRFRRVPVCAGVGSGGRFRKVPEAGSGRFRGVPACAGVGSGGRFRKVPESSGVCWCRFRRQVPEGCRFRKVPESSGVCWYRRQVPEGSGEFHAGVGSGGRSPRFRVPACAFCKFRRKVPDSSDVCWCRFGR